MKGTSKVIMGATLVMVLSLAIVLGLVLVLLAELYCSLLLRRRQIKLSKNNAANATSSTTSAAAIEAPREAAQYPSPLSSFYAQGVLHAPRSFLFPSRREGSSANANADVEGQHGKLHQFLSLQTALESATSSPPPPPPPPTAKAPQPVELGQSGGIEQLVYICNPIYENDGGADSDGEEDHTPFETPDTSPTRLERVDEEGKGRVPTPTMTTTSTPPLTPIKQLPAKACSVALRDARSLGTSGSESNSLNAAFSPSYSGSPSTSSW